MSNVLGQRFGKLTVMSTYSKRGTNCICVCDCGATADVTLSHLRHGGVKSCGCLKKEKIISFSTIHGMAHTRVYRMYKAMKTRCLNPNAANYMYYGGKGINICKRWLDSFDNFLTDMGNPPSETHTLDRINSNGNYDPVNCRWADKKQQSRNRSSNRFITYKNETRCVSEWAELLGISESALKQRLNDGWEVERAFTQPVRKRNS